jgi:hypothetical protein
MDYSKINDADNPVGASPWGSSPASSPKHARSSSYGTAGEVPPSPTPYSSNQQGNGSYSQEDTMGGGSYTRPDSSAGTESVAESDDNRPDTAESVHNEQPFLGQQQQQPPAQGHRQEPQRYHTAARQAQQPQGPQYKLQAKITGLERTGRKDPILRFDVHVSIPSDLSIL